MSGSRMLDETLQSLQSPQSLQSLESRLGPLLVWLSSLPLSTDVEESLMRRAVAIETRVRDDLRLTRESSERGDNRTVDECRERLVRATDEFARVADEFARIAALNGSGSRSAR